MKVLVLGATGGTGRLIVRSRPGQRPFRRGPGAGRESAPGKSSQESGRRLTDIHVSLLSRKNTGAQARSGEREFLGQGLQLASLPLGCGPCVRRTGHPFAASGPQGPSQKIELVFSASPKTVSGEPEEVLISIAHSDRAGPGSPPVRHV